MLQNGYHTNSNPGLTVIILTDAQGVKFSENIRILERCENIIFIASVHKTLGFSRVG